MIINLHELPISRAEKNREYQRAWYARNRERKLEQSRANYRAKKEEHLARSLKWSRANPEKRRAIKARYNEQNKDKIAAQTLARRRANPEKVRDNCARRRARRKNAPVIEKIDRAAIYARDRGICHICRRRVSKKSYTLDHLVPLIHGGHHTAQNLAVAHLSCNSRRGPGRIDAQLRLIG